jgi:hypothetical protein
MTPEFKEIFYNGLEIGLMFGIGASAFFISICLEYRKW